MLATRSPEEHRRCRVHTRSWARGPAHLPQHCSRHQVAAETCSGRSRHGTTAARDSPSAYCRCPLAALMAARRPTDPRRGSGSGRWRTDRGPGRWLRSPTVQAPGRASCWKLVMADKPDMVHMDSTTRVCYYMENVDCQERKRKRKRKRKLESFIWNMSEREIFFFFENIRNFNTLKWRAIARREASW